MSSAEQIAELAERGELDVKHGGSGKNRTKLEQVCFSTHPPFIDIMICRPKPSTRMSEAILGRLSKLAPMEKGLAKVLDPIPN